MFLSVSVDATVIRARDGTFYGLSTDTKPTTEVNENTKFYEYDTSRVFTYTGSSWKIFSKGYTTLPDTLTAKGSSTAYSVTGFSGFTVQVDVANVNTNLYTYLEGKAANTTGSAGWSSLPSLAVPSTRTSCKNDSLVIDTNGTFMWRWEGYIDSVRATVSAGSGETTFRAVWRWMFGSN